MAVDLEVPGIHLNEKRPALQRGPAFSVRSTEGYFKRKRMGSENFTFTGLPR